jgi:hypothetical protein
LHLGHYYDNFKLVNKKLVGILIVLILIGVGASFVVKRAPQTTTKQPPTVTKAPTVTPKETMQGTLRSLISSKKPQICTYSNDLGSASVSGTVYLADGKVKADFTSVSEENKISGHMIINDGYAYIWTGTTSKGIKIVFDPNQPTGTPLNSQVPDLNQSFAYACKEWKTDASLFAPPLNVDFSLISVPAQPSGAVSPASGSVTNGSACSVCDKLPAGESQVACRAQFHCK